MEDLLLEFDPLSITNEHLPTKDKGEEPRKLSTAAPPPPATTRLTTSNTNNNPTHQSIKFRTSSSNPSIPLFSINHHQPSTTTTPSSKPSSSTQPTTTTTTRIINNNPRNREGTKDHLIRISNPVETQDPLGSLLLLSSKKNPSTQPHPSLLQAQIRSNLRQYELAQHLAHQPFMRSTQAHHHLEGLHHPEIKLTSDSSIQSHSIHEPQPSPITCFINPPSTTTTTTNPKDQTTPPPPPQPPLSILSPSELHHRSQPTLTQPIDQHKLAAALLEDFDDFVSAPKLPNHSQRTSIDPFQSPPSQPIIHPTPNSSPPFSRQLEPTSSAHLKPHPSRLDSSPTTRSPSTGHSTPLSLFDGYEGRPNPIRLIGIDSHSQPVMDDELAEGIRLHLPTRLKISSKWQLLYSIDQHGTSLGTLYDKVGTISSIDSTAGCILALRDQNGDRFGAFVNEAFRPSKEYYGTGECFLWKAVMFEPDDFRIGSSIKVFHWTGANDYMILSDHDLLSIGGGDGKFGLWIDSNLTKGASSRCPAFNNEVLCSTVSSGSNEGHHPQSDDGSFDVIGLECWMVSV